MAKDQEKSSNIGCIVILALIFITIFWVIPGGFDSVTNGGSFMDGAKNIVAFNLFAVVVGVIVYLVIRDMNKN